MSNREYESGQATDWGDVADSDRAANRITGGIKVPRVLNVRKDGLPEDVEYIGRRARVLRDGKARWLQQSKWANLFQIGRDGTRLEVIAKYRVWLMEKIAAGELDPKELRGKDVACWCYPEPCHGDIVVELANASSRMKQN